MLFCPRRLLFKHRGLPLGVLDPLARNVKVFRLAFNSCKRAPHLYRCHAGCSATHERIANRFRFRGVVNAPLHQAHRLLRRVLFLVTRHAQAVYLCRLFERAPSLLAHRQAKVLRLHLVPHQKRLARRQREVITPPHTIRFFAFSCISPNSHAAGASASHSMRSCAWRTGFAAIPIPYGGSVKIRSQPGSVGSISRQSPRYSVAIPIVSILIVFSTVAL